MTTAFDNASFYKKAVEVFDLPADKAEKVAAQMAALGVGRDDAYMLLFLATARAEALTETIPGKIEKAGADLLDGVGASLDKALDDKLGEIPALLSDKLDNRLAEFSERLGQSVDSAIVKEATRRTAARTASFGLFAILLLGVFGGWGYMIGRDTINSEAAKWQSLVSLPDGGKWLGLAKLNDIDKVLAQSCGPSSGRIVAGGKVCDLGLYVTAPVATSKGMDAVNLTVAEYANKAGTWGLLGIGAVFGLIVGRVSKRRATA